MSFARAVFVTMTAAAGLLCGACTHHESAASATGHVSDEASHHEDGMHPYVASASDPAWLRKASEFHGHLGPWSTIGTLLGRDAAARLGGPGAWDIRVVCWTPPAKRKPPFSCIMDGLQCGSGATMGKRNIGFAWENGRDPAERPEVYIAKAGPDGRLSRGFSYRVSQRLLGELQAAVAAGTLESFSRRLAGMRSDELFDIRPLTDAQLARSAELLAAGVSD